jgi:hypothetical protein
VVEGIMRKVIVFLQGPWLWARAVRDHGKAIDAFNKARGTDRQTAAFDATWEPFNRTFDHLIPAFVMFVVYGVALMVAGTAVWSWWYR